MNRIDRNSVNKPDCLEKNATQWTTHFIEKRKTNKKYWGWHKYGGIPVEQILTPCLADLTKEHCSYCGIFPLMKDVGGRSIDHFMPKSKFPESAFEWENLFIACVDCQKIKGNNYPNIEPLKPDNQTYTFEYWFRIDWKTNCIIPNDYQLTVEEQEIAQTTIEWLGLNNGHRPKARNKELKKYITSPITDVWEWNYPYFLEAWKKDNP